VTERDVRHFAIYREGRLVLVVRDNPGTLRSTAGPPAGGGGPPPPPPGPPGEDAGLPPGVHPFIDAQAHDPVTEGRLRALLDESTGFDDYLAKLLGAGFDIASCLPGEGLDYGLSGGARLLDGDTLVGACWPRRGQFSSLRHQPVEGELVFDSAVLTAYAEDWAPRLLDALEHAGDHGELIERLGAAGLSTAALPG
jgi:hypothetical protein